MSGHPGPVARLDHVERGLDVRVSAHGAIHPGVDRAELARIRAKQLRCEFGDPNPVGKLRYQMARGRPGEPRPGLGRECTGGAQFIAISSNSSGLGAIVRLRNSAGRYFSCFTASLSEKRMMPRGGAGAMRGR